VSGIALPTVGDNVTSTGASVGWAVGARVGKRVGDAVGALVVGALWIGASVGLGTGLGTGLGGVPETEVATCPPQEFNAKHDWRASELSRPA